MSLNLEENTFQPTEEHFKIDSPDHPSDFAVLASYCYDDSTNENEDNGDGSAKLSYSEEEEIEFTDKELYMVEHTAETLMRERSQKRDNEKELMQIRSNLQKIMESDVPFQMKIKLMESVNELLLTKMSCMRENNNDIKEKLLNVERINSYMTSLGILSDWKRNGKLTTELPGQMATNPTNNMLFTEAVTEEAHNEREYVEQLRSEVQNLEGVIVLLKQTSIPLAISYENLKEEFDEMQVIVKERKRALEEKLREVESLKGKIARRESYKENINPQTDRARKNDKLRDIYMDYGEKAHDLSISRINMSTVNNNNNKTVLQEASTKLSKMFGSIFKSKKEKVSENILTADVLKDLGIGSATKR